MVLAALEPGARRKVEAIMVQKYEYQSEYARRYFGQGLAEGKAEGLAEGKAEGLAEGLAERIDELTSLYRWYSDWSATARAVIARRDC